MRGDALKRPASLRSHCFNPRPSVRGDQMDKRIVGESVFQSTPLCEGRPLSMSITIASSGFNPRPSVRGDKRSTKSIATFASFNPRPSVRGDLRPGRQAAGRAGFNPRPSVRGDRRAGWRCWRSTSFNPRPSVRGDPWVWAITFGQCEFQSTPLCEGRHAGQRPHPHGDGVSIHAPL